MLALFKEYLHPALYLLFTHIKNMFLTSREAKRPQAQTPEKLVCCCLLLSLLAHGNWFLCHIHISSILWKQKRKRKKKALAFSHTNTLMVTAGWLSQRCAINTCSQGFFLRWSPS